MDKDPKLRQKREEQERTYETDKEEFKSKRPNKFYNDMGDRYQNSAEAHQEFKWLRRFK